MVTNLNMEYTAQAIANRFIELAYNYRVKSKEHSFYINALELHKLVVIAHGVHMFLCDKELLSNLVFEVFPSSCDLAVFDFFYSVFEFDACDDFGQIIKAA